MSPETPKNPHIETWEAARKPADAAEDRYRWPLPPEAIPERLPWMSWLYSLLLPIAIWLIVVSVFFQIRSEPNLVTFTVTDSSTGEPIPGTEFIVDTMIYRADDRGELTIEPPTVGATITVRAEGYRAIRGLFLEGSSSVQRVTLSESTLIGKVTGEGTGDPIVGALVFVTDPTGSVESRTTTDSAGAFRLVGLPDQAILHVEASGYISTSIEVGLSDEMLVELAPAAESRSREPRVWTADSESSSLRTSGHDSVRHGRTAA